MNKDELINKLNQSERPTVVDFWAPWCGPCRTTKPVLEKLAEEYAGRVDFRTINADENPELLKELKIFGIPTLLIMDKDKNISRRTGAQSPQNYRQLFESLASGEGTPVLPMSNFDRILRLGGGGLLLLIAWQYALWWLLPIGLVVMFLGIYDRCPIWGAIRARFL